MCMFYNFPAQKTVLSRFSKTNLTKSQPKIMSKYIPVQCCQKECCFVSRFPDCARLSFRVCVWSIDGTMLTGGDKSSLIKTCPGATFAIKNLPKPDRVSNTQLQRGMPTAGRSPSKQYLEIQLLLCRKKRLLNNKDQRFNVLRPEIFVLCKSHTKDGLSKVLTWV